MISLRIKFQFTKKKKKKLRDKETCKIKPHKCNYEDPDGDTLVEK